MPRRRLNRRLKKAFLTNANQSVVSVSASPAAVKPIPSDNNGSHSWHYHNWNKTFEFNEEYKYDCLYKECNEKNCFPNQKNLLRHLRQNHMQCNYYDCNTRGSLAELEEHMERVHNRFAKLPFKCPHSRCRYKFRSLARLVQHDIIDH